MTPSGSKRTFSEQHKRNLSARIITPEWRANLSAAAKKRKDSDETRAKKSASGMGRIGPNLGRIFSSEVRKRMSMARKGKQFSESHRKALSEALKGHIPNPGSHKSIGCEYIRPDGETVRLASSYEYEIAKYLDSIEEEWRYVTYSKVDSFLLSDRRRYYPDFFLPRINIYIDPKGFDRDPIKRGMVEKEYPGRVIFLIGKTYLIQLKEILCNR